jgi:hypothetical protein
LQKNKQENMHNHKIVGLSFYQTEINITSGTCKEETQTSFQNFQDLKQLIGYTDFKPNAETLINETVNEDYIVKTQKPDYEKDPRYIDEINDLPTLKKTNFVF